MIDKGRKLNPNYQNHNLVCRADLEKRFSKGDTTNWSHKFYESTEIVKDTIPSYKIDQLLETYNEALLKKTQLTMKEIKDIMEALDLYYIKMSASITSHTHHFIC